MKVSLTIKRMEPQTTGSIPVRREVESWFSFFRAWKFKAYPAIVSVMFGQLNPPGKTSMCTTCKTLEFARVYEFGSEIEKPVCEPYHDRMSALLDCPSGTVRTHLPWVRCPTLGIFHYRYPSGYMWTGLPCRSGREKEGENSTLGTFTPNGSRIRKKEHTAFGAWDDSSYVIMIRNRSRPRFYCCMFRWHRTASTE